MADDAAAAGAAEERPTSPPPETAKAAKTPITIPSYPPASSSASSAAPSNAFSEAFSFIKSSEFYTPPTAEKAPRQAEVPASASTAPKSAYPNAASRNSILVSHRQKGNPLLKHIRNVRWMFADVVCDYLIGQSSCALYLSLRYHLLHPDYLYFRIRELQKECRLRVVLCHVDVEDVVKPLLEVTKTALLHDCTLLCGWSLEECGRYLETIKVYENKSADSIKERMDTDYMSRLNYALTSVRHVNKSDVVTLGSTFGSLSNIMDASMEDLARCPGIGDRKVKRLHDTFHEPFKRVVSNRPAIHVNPDLEKANEDTSKEESGGHNESEEAPKNTVKSALFAAFAKYNERVRKDKEILNADFAQSSDSMNSEEKDASLL